jgi:hypothetical protein
MNETTTPATPASEVEAEDAIIPDEDVEESHTDTTPEPAEVSNKDTQPDQGVETTVSDSDKTELLEWAKSKGIPVDDPDSLTPTALKAIEVARNGEKGFHASRQEASTKLKDTATEAVTTGDDLADEVRFLRVERNIDKFESSLRDQGLKKDEIEAIKDEVADILVAKPYLGVDLEAAYAIVNNSKSQKLIDKAKLEGREEAKAEIARASSSVMPKGNASGTTPMDNTDPGLKAFDEAF